MGKHRQATGLKPLPDFRLKAVLRRDGSPARTSPSESRLQPEACEGLQARVSDPNKAFVVPATTVGTEPDPPVPFDDDGYYEAWRDDLRVVHLGSASAPGMVTGMVTGRL